MRPCSSNVEKIRGRMKEEGPGHDKHVLAAHDLRRSDRYDVYREDDARLHDVSIVKKARSGMLR